MAKGGLFLCGAILLCGCAHAQLSGSAGIVSDYRYRGISLSSGQAAPRAAINYDAADGWYAGGQVLGAQLSGASHRSAQWLGYAGYARQWPSGGSWEAGVSRYAFTQRPGWHFNEVYGGATLGDLSARISYASDYFGLRTRTWYGELSGGMDVPPMPRLRAFWHVGYLGSIHAAPGAMIGRLDARLGVQAAWQDWRAELSFDAARKRKTGATYDYGREPRTTHGVVLSVARVF